MKHAGGLPTPLQPQEHPMPPDKALTREQIRRIDRLAIEEYGVPGIVLMENAGRNAARVIRRELLPAPTGGSVAIVCGSGNNGGDGFVIARHLANCAIGVALYVATDPARLSGDAAVNYGIVERMGLPIVDVRAPDSLAAAIPKWRACDVIVDALLGTGFTGQVRAPLDAVIDAINNVRGSSARQKTGTNPPARRPVVVAIDVPSGLDADTGRPSNATIEADLTITMAARKVGFDAPGADRYTGRIVLVDIGAPRALLEPPGEQAQRPRPGASPA